jgi:hypothetical protein
LRGKGTGKLERREGGEHKLAEIEDCRHCWERRVEEEQREDKSEEFHQAGRIMQTPANNQKLAYHLVFSCSFINDNMGRSFCLSVEDKFKNSLNVQNSSMHIYM